MRFRNKRWAPVARAIRILALLTPAVLAAADTITFTSGTLQLKGILYKPTGAGPFPAIVYNHGSAKNYSRQIEALGPVFVARGWVFFAPYRRGQGLSASAAPYVGDQMDEAAKKGGEAARSATMVRLLETEQLDDQLAGAAWLKKAPFVDPQRVAVAGNSFGGIQTVLGAERGSYCAAVDSAGAAETWAESPDMRALLTRSVRNARVPIFFFQAENDYDLSPSRTLSGEMKAAGKKYEVKIYPPFGESKERGHSFGYFGSAVWANDVFRFLEENCPKSGTR